MKYKKGEPLSVQEAQSLVNTNQLIFIVYESVNPMDRHHNFKGVGKLATVGKNIALVEVDATPKVPDYGACAELPFDTQSDDDYLYDCDGNSYEFFTAVKK